MSFLSPKNDLYAVLLCIQSRAGAKIVFSYTSGTDAEVNLTSLEAKAENAIQDKSNSIVSASRFLDVSSHREHNQASSLRQDSAPGTTLGIKTEVLEKLLTPGRWSDGKKFEVTVDTLTFIGEPCYAYENGSWSLAAPIELAHEHSHGSETPAINIREHDPRPQPVRDFTHIADSFDSRTSGHSLATSMGSVSTRSGDVSDGFLMFHVVFVMQQGQHTSCQSSLTASIVHEHLARPLTKALRYLQEQYRYVELECRHILALKARPTTEDTSDALMADGISSGSGLAWALKELYSAISTGNIATIRLHGIEMALQIPETNVNLPLESSAIYLALMLLEDKSKMLRSLENHPEAAAMSFFITHLVPTKPLSKMASKLALPPSAVLFLAEHLIRWRKARLVPPLHARNTYVISPDVSMDELASLTKEYSKRFPALPGLQKMLGILGAPKPIVYGSCFPSKVHRDAYMDILEWLVSKGLATRMRTFGWLKLHVTASATDRAEHEASEEFDDSGSTISDSGTAFRPDDQHLAARTLPRRILDPTDMSLEERGAVIQLRHSLHDIEMQDIFSRLLRYLDGEHAFEDIATVEGLKRSHVEECLSKLTNLEALQIFQCP